MKMIFRQALEKELPAAQEILGPWIDEDPSLHELLQAAVTRTDSGHCRVLEIGDRVSCVTLWTAERPGHVRLAAVGALPEAANSGGVARALRQEIMEWADKGVSKATISVPERFVPSLAASLKSCGFVFEGRCSSCGNEAGPWSTFCKRFVYRIVSPAELVDVLKDYLVDLGYEVRNEREGLSYRVRPDFQFPFLSSSWHSITSSGGDLIAHPPAHVLQWHELETLFYPLTIRPPDERPLLIPLERKKAARVIDLPESNDCQASLFNHCGDLRARQIDLGEVAFVDPTGVQGVRKGLSLLFYVNRVGAVGTAKVEDWMLDDVDSLLTALERSGWLDHEEASAKETVQARPKSGKALAVKFDWRKSFARPVKLEEIRALDKNFSPQRVRCVSSDLFQSIAARGAEGAP